MEENQGISRTTDGRAIAYSKRDREFMFAKKVKVGFFYSTTYTVNSRNQPHFTI